MPYMGIFDYCHIWNMHPRTYQKWIFNSYGQFFYRVAQGPVSPSSGSPDLGPSPGPHNTIKSFLFWNWYQFTKIIQSSSCLNLLFIGCLRAQLNIQCHLNFETYKFEQIYGICKGGLHKCFNAKKKYICHMSFQSLT